MEDILRELLETQKEILKEIRLLRLSMTGNAAQGESAEQAGPLERLEEAMSPLADGLDVKKARHAPRLTISDLQDIGGSFLDGAPKKSKGASRATGGPHSAILDEIKETNRKKRDAFSDFERLNRDR